MLHAHGHQPGSQQSLFASPTVRHAIALLRDAYERARATNLSPWEFAVEIRELRTAGLTGAELRWLLTSGYVTHGEEETHPDISHRSFRVLQNLSLPESACFVLTDSGVQVAWSTASPHPDLSSVPAAGQGGDRETGAVHPCWDGECRRLHFRGWLVKDFRTPAENQETILAAFEEEGWPERVDDPLPPAPGVEPKTRLHDAIKRLNRNQARAMLLFRGDGTGKGITWEAREA